MTSPVRVDGQAREVALAEAQAVRALASGEDYRERLAGLVSAIDEGEGEGEDAQTLEEVLGAGPPGGGGAARARPPERPDPRPLRAWRRAGRPLALSTAAARGRAGRECSGGHRRPPCGRGSGARLGRTDRGRARRLLARDRRRRARGLAPARPPGGARLERGRMTDEKRYYLACLDLNGRNCLVVGGGKVGLEKAKGLLECGAVVTV